MTARAPRLPLVALALLLVGLAGSVAPPSEEALAPCADPSTHELTTADHERILGELDELYASFEGLPGFLDVYFTPGLDPPYRATFLERVPEQARERVPYARVALDAFVGELVPLGPGPAPDVNDALCIGVRPGMNLGGGCTVAFILTDGNTYYASTAGHCTRVGDTFYTGAFSAIVQWGETVYSTDAGVGNDFALVEVLPDAVPLVTGEMCQWAGPTAMFTGSSISGRPTVQTGNGGGSLGVPPRPKVGLGASWGSKSFTWTGYSIPGDSGSPIRLESGEALGVVTHLGVSFPGTNFGTRLSHGISLAAQAGFPNLQLVTVAWTHPP